MQMQQEYFPVFPCLYIYVFVYCISLVSVCHIYPVPDIGSQVCLVINWSFFQTFSIRYTKDSALERHRICIFVLVLLV